MSSLDTPAEGSLRPDEERNVIQRFENGQWVDISESSMIIPRSIFRMTPEQRAEIMAKNPPEITDLFYAGAYFGWTWMGCGFGQLSFDMNKETGKITCMDEHMGRERARTILHALADHIADNAVFD